MKRCPHLDNVLNVPPKNNLSHYPQASSSPPSSGPWQAPHLVELPLLHETSAYVGMTDDGEIPAGSLS